MAYRVSHQFARVEALGTTDQSGRFNDPADPLTLEVRVTTADDVDTIIESVSLTDDPRKLLRLTTGQWAYDLTAELYQQGRQYVVHFRYTMTPNNLKVDRLGFTWQPGPDTSADPEKCVVYGMLADIAGNPIPDFQITVEQYVDALTLNHRVGTLDVRSDVFGNWWIEVKRGTILRFLYGELEKVIVVPDLSRAQLSKVAVWQPADVRKDRFGYPLP
jgi:hypothetical protein